MGILLLYVIFTATIWAQPGISFQGCVHHAMPGTQPAPVAPSQPIPAALRVRDDLTWFEAAGNLRLPGPRGWPCVAYSGSSGATLFITPQPVDGLPLSNPTGPAIELHLASGGASGVYFIAHVIARVFPSKHALARGVERGIPEMGPPVFSPFPKDTLQYETPASLSFRTPPGAEGLGTMSDLYLPAGKLRGVHPNTNPEPSLVP